MGGGSLKPAGAGPEPHVVRPGLIVAPVLLLGKIWMQHGPAGGQGWDMHADIAVVHGQGGAIAEGTVKVPAEAHRLVRGGGVVVQVELVIVVVGFDVVDDGLEWLLA